MAVYLNLFGKEIPAYGTIAIIGLLAGLLAALYLSGRHGIPKRDVFCCLGYGGIGAVIGAKLFYMLPVLVKLLGSIFTQGADELGKNSGSILQELFAGYVFYGGWFGLMCGIYFYARMMRLWELPLFDIAATVTPLFHAFGRIGCFLAGCCYGIEYYGPFAVQFPENKLEPGIETVTRFPVQLVESLCCLILFFVLWHIMQGKKENPAGTALGVYLMAYPAIRFILEYFRADDVRGIFSVLGIMLSSAQIISLILFPIGYIIYKKAEDSAEMSMYTERGSQ